jgi:NADH-quinone oxidoreductase subunit L
MDKALIAVVLLPALGALINGLRASASPLTPKNRTVTGWIAMGATLLSALVATFFVVIPFMRGASREALDFSYYQWIPSGLGQVVGSGLSDFKVDLAFRVDPLSCTMLMIVTWIGFLIHVYATGYMAHEEKGFTRFFTYLNLFMFMMLLLVLGAN